MSISGLLQRHQLIAFFLLTFLFSWTIWLFLPPIPNSAVFGPFLAAVLLSAIVAPQQVNDAPVRRWAIAAVVFAVALGMWLLFLPSLTDKYTQQPWYAIWVEGVPSCLILAFLLSGPLSTRRGARDLVARVSEWKVGWLYYAAALLLGPALWLLPVVLDLAMGGKLPAWPRGAPTLALVLVTFLWIAPFGGGQEEPGWRGFALPRLQGRWNPLVASIILGFFWAIWHAPEYFTGQYTESSSTGPAAIAGIIIRFVWVIPLAIIFTWFYNRSGRNILMLTLLHASFNTATAIVPMSFQAGTLMLGTMWLAALVVMLSGRMWRKLQPEATTSASNPIGVATGAFSPS